MVVGVTASEARFRPADLSGSCRHRHPSRSMQALAPRLILWSTRRKTSRLCLLVCLVLTCMSRSLSHLSAPRDMCSSCKPLLLASSPLCWTGRLMVQGLVNQGQELLDFKRPSDPLVVLL
uniref:Uncharacterized protein n=1 Tax=Kalanchoe fedtschenkoi TaxID=63787 RepID=A0A7N0UKN4_KALFE